MHSRTHSYDGSLLASGPGVWRTETVHRFAVLMENDAYFAALASALEKAERSIVILGWQFDPRTHLSVDAADDVTAEIGHRLRLLVKQKPDLDVRLLIWKSPLLIAASQGFYPHRAQRWFRKRMVEFRLDQPGPIGACHHQKAVIIDDKVAFCGGGDIATDRWDSLHHHDDDPRRCQPSGLIAPPRHETMCVFDGPAARALGDLARERWFRATWERTLPDETRNDPWPDGVEPVIRDAPIGISRTEPATGGRAEVRENEALHLEAIRRARRLIYLENQYFTSPLVADALAERLAEPDGPEIVLVSTGKSPSWFDSFTMDKARAQVLYRLEQADKHSRFLALAPRTKGGKRIIVHAKVSIIDDRLLRIGSTNINNRSFGFDTECDVSVEPTDAAGQEAIRRHRHHALGHFLGVSGEEFGAAEEVMGSMSAAVAAVDTGRIQPLGSEPPSWFQSQIADWQLGDPVSSADAWRPWKRRGRSRALQAG